MINIRIIHIKEDGLIDFAYLYDDNLKKALEDIEKIKETENYRVTIYDDQLCTEYDATYYTLDYFKKMYGDQKNETTSNTMGKKKRKKIKETK